MAETSTHGRRKTISLIALAFVVLGVVAIFDWNYFFPLNEHSDLSFQLTGELVSLALYGLSLGIFLSQVRNVKKKREFAARPKFVRFFVAGLPWAVWMIGINWRENFDGHQFHARSLLVNILIWMVAGLTMGFAMSGIYTDQPIVDTSTV